jgi:aminoglycoside 3-N-acetyltransferase
MRNLLRKLIPTALLEIYRSYKKKKVSNEIQKSKERGDAFTFDELKNDLIKMGIVEGDTVLVHSSLSKIGYVSGGPSTIIDALISVVGQSGHILMPNSPNAGLQLEYIRDLMCFDVNNDASKLGAITEAFRTYQGAIRSEHPTEPVSCFGPNAKSFTKDHFGNLTPYNKNSPFYKVSERKGKILYIGVTFDNAGTNLHTLEDAVEDFHEPVYFEETFDVQIKSADGTLRNMKTKVHNPVQSAKRKCDGLIPLFEQRKVLFKASFGNAETLVVDAERMLQVMIEEYKINGVTMYNPKGKN